MHHLVDEKRRMEGQEATRQGAETGAVAALQAGAPFEEWRYTQRTLQEDDVEVELTHCGVCHSDLHAWKGEFPGCIYPLVPGHEGVGIVKRVGSAVTDVSVGQVVGIGPHSGCCQTCNWCKLYQDVMCPKKVVTYGGRDQLGNITYGCFGYNITVSAHKAIPIPEGMDPAEAAPLLCAGVTTFTPLVENMKPHYKTCAVVGVGGLGHLAIQFAAAIGLEVTAISRSPEKEEEALSFGAKHFLLSSDEEAVAAAKDSFDMVLNTVPGNINMDMYLKMLAPLGAFVFLGVCIKSEFSPLPVLMKKLTICGGLIGGTQDTKDMLKFCAENNIRPKIEKLPFTPEGVNEAMRKIEDGSVRYRSVLCRDL